MSSDFILICPSHRKNRHNKSIKLDNEYNKLLTLQDDHKLAYVCTFACPQCHMCTKSCVIETNRIKTDPTRLRRAFSHRFGADFSALYPSIILQWTPWYCARSSFSLAWALLIFFYWRHKSRIHRQKYLSSLPNSFLAHTLMTLFSLWYRCSSFSLSKSPIHTFLSY